MKAGFYQFNPVFGNKKKNITSVANALKGIDVDLLVLPEFFATGYQFTSMEEVGYLAETIPDGETTEALASLSKNMECIWWLDSPKDLINIIIILQS